LNYEDNYVEHSNQLLEYQNFLQHCLLFLRFQQNYFDSSTKLFLDLYPAKFEIPQQNCSFVYEPIQKIWKKLITVTNLKSKWEIFTMMPILYESSLLLLPFYFMQIRYAASISRVYTLDGNYARGTRTFVWNVYSRVANSPIYIGIERNSQINLIRGQSLSHLGFIESARNLCGKFKIGRSFALRLNELRNMRSNYFNFLILIVYF